MVTATHLSISASTTRGMTSHFGLSIFLIWTATFPPIRPMVFIYLNWWDMLEFAHRSWILYVDFPDFHHVSFTKGSNLCYFVNRLLNSLNATVLLLRSMALRYGKLD